ncbi:MAG: DUF2961 domain-containing protein [Lentisphaeria bacterium]|nr:DUF2961 domain-containing protein [Lentisphaeria bacterium]
MGNGCRSGWLRGAVVAAACLASGLAAAVDTAGLLREMVDLEGLAAFPSPAFTCRQFSSYDRASVSPTQNWFANGDRGHFLRVEEVGERKEYVLMDAEGPGAVVRIWSANPEGVLRLYLDRGAAPVLEAPMKDVLGGRFPGLPRPFSGERSRGWNLYFPIPYAQHCKITSDRNGFYYHVNYRTYAEGTPVTSFTPSDLERLRGEIERVGAILSSPGGAQPPLPEAVPHRFDVALPAGGSAALGSFGGPQAIQRFRVQWQPSGDRDEPALRAVILSLTFDGETTVEAPLGDFFGSGPGIDAFESLPLSMNAEGVLESRWLMPFRERAEIRVRNLGSGTAQVRGEVTTVPYPWTDASLLFHAKWRVQHDLSTAEKFDWNYLSTTGKGVFAGVAFALDNPVKTWWGEGDEKIYVDGETFPSHFGTGTEDYFGYAWGSPDPFSHAYHNQPRCDGPGNFGRTSLNRFHVLDRIPFTRDFRFDMEIWHWKTCTIHAAVTAYWYARPGARDGFAALTADDVALRPAPEYVVPRVEGAIEGEKMTILAKTGTVEPQPWDGTSGGFHMWWRHGQKPGDTLVLGFEVPQAGRYRVFGRFLKAVDYGVAQLAVNGVKAGEPMDFFHDGVILTGEIELGTFDLAQGRNRFEISITGANEKAVKSYMTGVDYLLLRPAQIR